MEYLRALKTLSAYKSVSRFILGRPLFSCSVIILIFCIIKCAVFVPTESAIERKSKITLTGSVINVESFLEGSSLKANDCILIRVNEAYDEKNKRLDSEDVGKRIRIYMKSGSQPILPGNIVMCTGSFVPYERASNPGEFDRLLYYSSKKQKGIVYADKLRVINDHTDPIRSSACLLKKNLWKNIDYLYDKEEGGIIKSLLLGDRTALTSDVKNLYSDSQIIHILAISSMHLSFIALMIHSVLSSVHLKKKTVFIITISILSYYIIMCGQSVSMIRAVIVIGIRLFGEVIGADFDILTALGAALWIMLVDEPYRLYDSGFVFTFLCVFFIAHLIPKLNVSKLYSVFLFRIFMMPYIISVYHIYPLYSGIINLLIIPVLGALLSIGLFSIFSFNIFSVPAAASARICVIILNYFKTVCEFFARFEFLLIFPGSSRWYAYVISYSFLALLYVYEYQKRKKNKNVKEVNDEKKKYILSAFINSVSFKIRYRISCVKAGGVLFRRRPGKPGGGIGKPE